VADTLDLKDAVKRQALTITVVRTGDLEVIAHQRKPRPAHLKALTTSIERLGFLTVLVAVQRDGKYVIIDGQHRFQAGVELGARYQIISSANPTTRARKPSDFDKTFEKFLAALDKLAETPRSVLKEKVE
jgi:hypothetical protein